MVTCPKHGVPAIMEDWCTDINPGYYGNSGYNVMHDISCIGSQKLPEKCYKGKMVHMVTSWHRFNAVRVNVA